MATLTLSPELFKTLQKIAEDDQCSVDALIESVLTEYTKVRIISDADIPSDEEIAAVKQTIAEAEKPDTVWYNQEEIEAEIFEMIDNYQPLRSKAG